MTSEKRLTVNVLRLESFNGDGHLSCRCRKYFDFSKTQTILLDFRTVLNQVCKRTFAFNISCASSCLYCWNSEWV